MDETIRSSKRQPTQFCVHVMPERDTVRVVPVGELDLATAGGLEAQLHELRDTGFAHVVLDLRELEFLGSSGIRVIVIEHQCARPRGRDFSLIGGSPAVQRALELCGLLEQLTFRRG